MAAASAAYHARVATTDQWTKWADEHPRALIRADCQAGVSTFLRHYVSSVFKGGPVLFLVCSGRKAALATMMFGQGRPDVTVRALPLTGLSDWTLRASPPRPYALIVVDDAYYVSQEDLASLLDGKMPHLADGSTRFLLGQTRHCLERVARDPVAECLLSYLWEYHHLPCPVLPSLEPHYTGVEVWWPEPKRDENGRVRPLAFH